MQAGASLRAQDPFSGSECLSMTKTATKKAAIRDGRLLVDGEAVSLPTGGRKVTACFATRNGKFVVAADDLAGIYLLEGDKVVWHGNLIPGTTQKVAVSEDGTYVFVLHDYRETILTVFARGPREWNVCMKILTGSLPQTKETRDIGGEKSPIPDVRVELPRCAISVIRGKLSVVTQDEGTWLCRQVI
ncbi:MAG: hypothetical protein G01um101425_701 [Candidatus Peregrinibacteria bacterium Gr01-1014_25]|nr:MAG: hypothetical protein G01um101425_701 [Candidatus Peregrinibacteria bacterium Gr01-1014_25]